MSKVIHGWYSHKSNIFKTLECGGCKMSWSSKVGKITCDRCHRNYKLDNTNIEKVIMDTEYNPVQESDVPFLEGG